MFPITLLQANLIRKGDSLTMITQKLATTNPKIGLVCIVFLLDFHRSKQAPWVLALALFLQA